MKRNNLKQPARVSRHLSITHFDAPGVFSYVTKSSYLTVLDFKGINLINYIVCVCVCVWAIHHRTDDDCVTPACLPVCCVGVNPRVLDFLAYDWGVSPPAYVPEGDNRGLFRTWSMFRTFIRPICLQGPFKTLISGLLGCFCFSQGVFAIIDDVRDRLPHWFASWVQPWQIHLGGRLHKTPNCCSWF